MPVARCRCVVITARGTKAKLGDYVPIDLMQEKP